MVMISIVVGTAPDVIAAALITAVAIVVAAAIDAATVAVSAPAVVNALLLLWL